MKGDQKIQENQYEVPYHWFFQSDEYRGRKYFGYTNLALRKAQKYGLQIDEARVLDAGCGDGRFLRTLKESGVRFVEGIDYSERAISFAKILLPGCTLHVGDFTKQDTLKELGGFDCVFLIETLEHIHPDNVQLVLKNISNLINESGIFVITVPSTGLPLHDKHFQHFTKESLTKCVEKYFEVLEISGYANAQRPFLSFVYKLFDNRWWNIKGLSKWFNKTIWPKYFNSCDADSGEGLILVARKRS